MNWCGPARAAGRHCWRLFSYQVTKVTDAFGRYCQLGYDSQGYLNSITDGIGLATSFTYDSATARRGWITNMSSTPYGTTSFAYGGDQAESSSFWSAISGVNRYV